MNYLHKKKLAFMSIVNRVKGFIRTITGALPLTLEGCVDEESITYYKLYGQSVQNGTPMPDTPVEVESVGEKTRNLFNYADYTTLTNYNGNDISANWLTIDGDLFYIKHDYYNGGCWLTPTKQWGLLAGTYTLSGKCKDNSIKGNPLICYCGIRWSDDTRNAGWGKPNSNDGEWYNFSYTFTITEDKTVKGIYLQDNGATAKSSICFTNIQLEEGSTATEYEPYGYKIPIKVSGNDKTITTNIYLDEPLRKVGDYADYVDLENGKVVRNVGKYTFTGKETDEGGTTNDPDCFGYVIQLSNLSLSSNKVGLCNYLKQEKFVTKDANRFTYLGIANHPYVYVYFKKTDFPELETYSPTTAKQVVKQMYDSGVPMILYYNRNKPTETPITLPTIPTFKGTSIISADTTVQPSNAEIEYYSNVKE